MAYSGRLASVSTVGRSAVGPTPTASSDCGARANPSHCPNQPKPQPTNLTASLALVRSSTLEPTTSHSMATPSTSRIAVKSEPGTVPSRRSRAQFDDSDSDEADPDQPTQPTKRRRSETLEQTQATQNGGDDEDEVAPRSTVLLRDSTGSVTRSRAQIRASTRLGAEQWLSRFRV